MAAHSKKRQSSGLGPLAARAAALVILILVLIWVIGWTGILRPAGAESPSVEAPPAVQTAEQPSAAPTAAPQATEPPAATAEPDPIPTPTPVPGFAPHPVDSTRPENYIKSTLLQVDGETVAVADYVCDDVIDFLYGEDYSALPGVITFRGDNFRSGAAWGTAQVGSGEVSAAWSLAIGSLQAPDGEVWTGSGWTGQPLIVSWPRETRQQMNLYDWAKEQEELVEVIYATMDGKIYFLELETGRRTRDDLNIGYTFKGAGSLDPRGYPLLYVGAGYDSLKGGSHAFIISLIDGSILFEFGQNDAFALRAWHMFDSAPLVDAETDTLIWPGESGILYKIKLNTAYDAAAGSIDIRPQVTKWRYAHSRSFGWLGMEDSAAIWRGHLFMADNGGCLMCLDLNTMETVWVQDTLDDTNCSPVLELEDGHPYLYISTSYHYGWRSYTTAAIPVWKIDGETGEIVWRTDYTCYTASGVSGGVQGTIALGQNDLSDLIFVPVARTPSAGTGKLAALSKSTGEVVWEVETLVYSWSSPVVFYDQNGKGYVVLTTSGGYLYVLDGLTGKSLDSLNLGSNVEASAAMYENTIVVGTRGQYIYGVRVK